MSMRDDFMCNDKQAKERSWTTRTPYLRKCAERHAQVILQTQRRYKASLIRRRTPTQTKKPVRSKGEIRRRKTNKSNQARRNRGKNRAMTTSTGIEKKKELLSSEERRGDARKEHDAGKILQEQATAETFPRKPSTNHGKKKEMQPKKKKNRRITQQTSWEVAGSRVRTSKEE